LVDGKPAVDVVDVVSADNTARLTNVVIPDDRRIPAIPTYLHEEYGVYNRGIGTFFQRYKGKKCWFVFPLYGTERFDEPGRKAVFYSVPQEKLPQLDKSWMLEGDLLKIAVTAQRRYSDTAELSLMNMGSGFRMPDARSFMKKPVVIEGDGFRAQRERLNHEVVIKDRDDGLNYAPLQGRASANPFKMRSGVLARYSAQLDLVWENADPDLLFPGMPCKFVHLQQGKAVTILGAILFVHGMSARVEKQGATAFSLTCRLTIGCDPYGSVPEVEETEVVGENQYLE
jgi:hypothetical protein